MKKVSVILIFILSNFILNACAQAGDIKGKITDVFGNPMKNFKITAVCQTDIQEELPKAKIQSTTNGNGEFIFKKGLTNREYEIIADGYILSTKSTINFPQNGTRIVETLYSIKEPSLEKIAYYIKRDGNLIRLPGKHDMYLTFRKSEVPIFNYNPTIVHVEHPMGDPILHRLKVNVEDENSIGFEMQSGDIFVNPIIEKRNSENNKITVFITKLSITDQITYYCVHNLYTSVVSP